MMTIHEIESKELKRKLKLGQVLPAHFPNGNICWAAKNSKGDILYFDYKLPYSKALLRFVTK